MGQALKRRMACPACRTPAESDWMVCPDCGTHLRPVAVKAPVSQKGNALDSADTGEVAFVPLTGGAKRPITVVTTAPPPMDAPTVALSELVVHARAAEVPPPPPTEDSYKHITILAPVREAPAPVAAAGPEPAAAAPAPPAPVAVAAPAVSSPAPAPLPEVQAAPAAPSPVVEAMHAAAKAAAEVQAEPPAVQKPVTITDLAAHAVPVPLGPAPPAPLEPEDEPPTEFAVEIAPEARPEVRPAAETFAEAPTLPSTVVVVSPDRALTARLTREDFAEIERLVEGAVNRAIREQLRQRALARTQQVQTAAPRTEPPESSHRAAAVGAGLLLGGAASDLLVLNYDVWIRGEAVNVAGWVQQLGLVGTAAIAGAGAAALVMGVARGRRRRRMARKVQVRGRAHTPG